MGNKIDLRKCYLLYLNKTYSSIICIAMSVTPNVSCSNSTQVTKIENNLIMFDLQRIQFIAIIEKTIRNASSTSTTYSRPSDRARLTIELKINLNFLISLPEIKFQFGLSSNVYLFSNQFQMHLKSTGMEKNYLMYRFSYSPRVKLIVCDKINHE